MKILSAAQIRAWDAYTIEHEPIASLELMNRAAARFVRWFARVYPDIRRPVHLLCGTGNNGGDGVAAARLLHELGFGAKVTVCDFAAKRSADFEAQIGLLPKHGNIEVQWLKSAQNLSPFSSEEIWVDALFGSGLNRPLTGDWAQMIDFLNGLPHEVVAIDLPSGLFADAHTPGEAVVRASRTFSFERPKLAFFYPENAERVGQWDYGSIGLSPAFESQLQTPFQLLSLPEALGLVRPRKKFSHKGSFGHALMVAGSFGKMGAAVLAARACLRSGVGLLSVHSPRCGNWVLQTAVPESMHSADRRAKFWSEVPDLQPYSAIGIGPGLGKSAETLAAFRQLLSAKPGAALVLDADALNLLSENSDLWQVLPKNTVLTPHPREFERLFGKSANDFERNRLQREKAQEHSIFIVLKGAHTAIACPDGACWFNSSGNPGMATGGSGDVLTGILTGLLAQGYPPHAACLLGVYLHGLAGDLAAAALSQEALIAGDLVDFLGKAWQVVMQQHDDLRGGD